jgi:hypothetical protein
MHTLTNLDRLDAAIQAEIVADRTAEDAESARRQAWWETTWAIAALSDNPRDVERLSARELYVRRTGHNPSAFSNRFRTGRAFPSFDGPLPRGRLAIEAVIHGADMKALLAAERDGLSLREFSVSLTGKEWADRPDGVAAAVERLGVAAIAEHLVTVAPSTLAEASVRPEVLAERARIRERNMRARTENRRNRRRERINADSSGALPVPKPIVASSAAAAAVRYAVKTLSEVRASGDTSEELRDEIDAAIDFFTAWRKDVV